MKNAEKNNPIPKIIIILFIFCTLSRQSNTNAANAKSTIMLNNANISPGVGIVFIVG